MKPIQRKKFEVNNIETTTSASLILRLPPLFYGMGNFGIKKPWFTCDMIWSFNIDKNHKSVQLYENEKSVKLESILRDYTF